MGTNGWPCGSRTHPSRGEGAQHGLPVGPWALHSPVRAEQDGFPNSPAAPRTFRMGTDGREGLGQAEAGNPIIRW